MVASLHDIPGYLDVESGAGDFLKNSLVRDFAWRGLSVTVKDRQSKVDRDLIHGVCGDVQAGLFLFSFLSFSATSFVLWMSCTDGL